MPEALYDFDDYKTGEKGITVPRTVSETDIINFACITGDYSRLHMDRHHAAQTMFKDRIAHGLLGASLATGMLSLDAPHIMGRGSTKAYFSGFEIDYRQVIKVGDTIKTKWQMVEKYDDPRNNKFGVVKTAFYIINQNDDSVYDGSVTITIEKEKTTGNSLPLNPGKPWAITQYNPDMGKVYYLEDYTPDGQGGETEGRTITETDIVNFAGLTGDYSPQHVDAEFAGQSLFGERTAHGMLIFTIAFAQWLREWSRFPMPDAGIAGHLNDKIRILAPVKIGDTLRCRHKTIHRRVSKSRQELGLVTFGLQVVNQKNEVVLENSVIMMIPSNSGTITG
jgi:3-hydroxybutyryl-CoA dehydratase